MLCTPALASIISIVKDALLGVAAIITATVAALGLRRWRQELRGKADFDVARGLIRASYRLRDEIATCRSPLIRAAEYPAARGGDPMLSPYEQPDRRSEAEALAHVYQQRWQRVSSALQEFDAQTLEAEALWGPDIRESTQQLRTCTTTLFVSIEAIIEDKASGGEHFERDRDFGRQMRANAHAAANVTDNELSNQIAAAVASLEAKLRSHLVRPR
jgi:hypothetical protein